METSFQITSQDLASAVWKQAQSNAKSSTDAIARSFRTASREASTFTGFIREQRQENRLQNFVFRETVQSINGISAAALALGGTMSGASKQTKEMVGSLTQGFLTFQGLEFALGALGAGPVGMAIAALGGLVAVFASISSQSSQLATHLAEVNSQIDQLNFKSGRASTRQNVDNLYNAWWKAKEALSLYYRTGKKDLELLGQLQLEEAKTYSAYQDAKASMHQKQVKRDKEDQDNIKEEIRLNEQRFQQSIAIARGYNRLVAPQLFKNDKTFTFSGIPNPNQKNIDQALTDIQKQFEANDFKTNIANDFEQIGFSGVNAAHMIANEMKNTAAIMTDAFFGATITIRDMFQVLFRDIVQMAIESLLKGAVFRVLGLLTGGATISSSTAGWSSLGIGGSAGVANVDNRTQVARAVRDAYLKEKI